MKNIYDIVVIGLGIMGSAALWRAAPLCSRVLGIDASGPSHSYGPHRETQESFDVHIGKAKNISRCSTTQTDYGMN